jgi:serine/threonine protein kinase/tetratricopeptide (TPR) repeat protein
MEDTAQNDERVMAIVSIAMRQSDSDRDPYLRLACAADDSLYRQTAELVKKREGLGSFLEHPIRREREGHTPFEVGQVISNRFEILKEIGEGGMAFVYEALDRKRNQRIAIKAAKPGYQRLLSPELQGALQVRHRNICLVNEIHTSVTSRGEIDFLTMELLEGETLSVYLKRRGRLESTEALGVARQLCAGLSAAHQSGVLHRDITSANIFLCPGADGTRAVITDFGLACGLQQAGEWGGTLRYMAPEVWRGQRPSKASDIYGLGVVLYEMVVGRPPFEHALNCLNTPLPAPSTLAGGLRSEWDDAILKCLEAAPEDRPADASLVAERITPKRVRRMPWVVALLVVPALAAIPPVRNSIRDWIWKPPDVRIAVLPIQSEGDLGISGGVMNDVADRVDHLPTGRRTVVVIPATEITDNLVQSPAHAKQVLHATHALQTTVRRENGELVARAAVIDLGSGEHVRDFVGRYNAQTIGSLPAALAGAVSLALRLKGSSPTETLNSDAAVPYDRGLFLFRSDPANFGQAIPFLQKAAQLDPRSPMPPAALAEARIIEYQTTGKRSSLDEAQRLLGAAESLNPDSARVRLIAGMLGQTAGQYEKALEDYRRAEELEPGNVDATLHMASIYNALDMNAEAIATYGRAIALEPEYFLPYRKLGEFYYYHSKYAEAAQQFQKAIERAPGLFDAYNELAAALSDSGQDDEAEKALLHSLAIRETGDAENSLGAIRAYQRRDREAQTFYERAVKLDPRVYVYWLNLADSKRRLGQAKDAKASYRKGMELALAELREDPHDGFTRAYVAYFFARLGDAARAEDEVSQARETAPSDTKVIRRAVLTYEALGKRDLALEAIRGAPPELIHELDRQPDLTQFRNDLRFKQVVTQISNGGK